MARVSSPSWPVRILAQLAFDQREILLDGRQELWPRVRERRVSDRRLNQVAEVV